MDRNKVAMERILIQRFEQFDKTAEKCAEASYKGQETLAQNYLVILKSIQQQIQSLISKMEEPKAEVDVLGETFIPLEGEQTSEEMSKLVISEEEKKAKVEDDGLLTYRCPMCDGRMRLVNAMGLIKCTNCSYES